MAIKAAVRVMLSLARVGRNDDAILRKSRPRSDTGHTNGDERAGSFFCPKLRPDLPPNWKKNRQYGRTALVRLGAAMPDLSTFLQTAQLFS
jgi:hypothetical protein